MRWANRYQLDACHTYVRALGMDIFLKSQCKGETNGVDCSRKSSDDKQTPLMRMEKYRWNAERTIGGWKYGPLRKSEYRIHTLVVPYTDFPEGEKYKDRNVIDNFPYLLALGGYCIV